VLEVGLSAALGTSLSLGRGEEGVKGEPSVLWQFLPTNRGTVLAGSYQNSDGVLADLNPKKVEQQAALVREQILEPALRFVALRSLFGPHATATMLAAAARPCVVNRVKTRCPELAASAEIAADMILGGRAGRLTWAGRRTKIPGSILEAERAPSCVHLITGGARHEIVGMDPPRGGGGGVAGGRGLQRRRRARDAG
jgi:hypothetical protein